MLARYRDARVVPLEVWDLVVGGVPLHRIERGPGFGAALGLAAEMLVAGVAKRQSSARFPDACRRIRRVVLAGGAADAIAWASARLPAERAARPERCAEEGGLAILRRAGKRGLVVDLGQSCLKIASATRRSTHPRDFDAIPVSQAPLEGRGRRALVAFVTRALREACSREPPDAMVIALPCEISSDCAIGTCTYPWKHGDPIVSEVLAAAGLADTPTWLLNDAELAAIGVAERAPVREPTLVLTIGYGVGGALLGSGA